MLLSGAVAPGVARCHRKNRGAADPCFAAPWPLGTNAVGERVQILEYLNVT